MRVPSFLDAEAKTLYKKLAPILVNRGCDLDTDSSVLASFCQAVARYQQCEKLISKFYKENGKFTYSYTNKNGFKNEITIPEIAISEKQAKLIKTFAIELGFSQSARRKLDIIDIQELDDDEMSNLLS